MSDAMFNGTHGPEGAWSSLKGKMLAPYEAQASHEDANMGDARFNGEVKGVQGWEASLLPVVAPTRGGGTMVK